MLLLVLRHAEIHPDRVKGGDIRQLGIAGHGVDVGALALHGLTGLTVERRVDPRVAKIEPGLVDRSFGGVHGGARAVKLPGGVVQVALRNRIELGQRLDARVVGLGGAQARLLHFQLPLHGIKLGLKGFGVDGEHQLPLLHRRAFGVMNGIQKAGYARGDLHALRTFGLGDKAHVGG